MIRPAGGLRHRALALLLGFACALAIGAVWAAARASADDAYKVAVYSTVDTSQQGLTGHVFVQLRHNATNEIYGKYPGGSWVFDTTGEIRNDGANLWSWRITYTVSKEEWDSARLFVTLERSHPDPYSLLSTNCVEFAADVVRRAGHELPPYKVFGAVPDPTHFTRFLGQVGSGKRFRGGLVLENPNAETTASGAPDPPPPTPPCCAVTSILRAAASNPHRLANALRLGFRSYRLPPARPTAGGRYTVRITHTDVHENLYAIRWGDGLTTDGVVPRRSGPGVVTFSHRYAPGWDGTLTAVVAQNGRVLEYVQRLRRGGAGSHMQVDSEPPPPPPHAFAPAPPP